MENENMMNKGMKENDISNVLFCVERRGMARLQE
jgi:hypothetical protein